MKITLIKIGKPAFPVIRELVQEYSKRLQPFCPFEVVELKDEKDLPPPKAGEHRVLFDEKGKTYSTQDLSKQFQQWIDNPGIKSLSVVIGGPYGFSDSTRKSANSSLSLSHLTLQGDLAWLVATEQIYRVFTVLKKMDYHH